MAEEYYRTAEKSKAGFIRLLEFGIGYLVINNPNGNESWGTPDTIRSLVDAAKKWAKNNNILLQYNDISLKEGGGFPPHKGHRRGREVDIRPIRKDGKVGSIKIGDSNYDRAKTEEFIKILLKDPNVRLIYFNDEEIKNKYKDKVKKKKGHDDHLHVAFKN